MTIRTRQDLAEDLRWLAGEYRKASPEMKAKIEAAFKRGQEMGEDPVKREMENLGLDPDTGQAV